MKPFLPSLPRLVIDGDIEQLDDVLLAIADLEEFSEQLSSFIALAKDSAAAMMIAAKIKERIVNRGAIPYVARVKRDTAKTVCACHGESPWDCPERRHGPIRLADRPEPPTVRVRIIRARKRQARDAA
jgi:hypothetical protein